MGLLETQLIKIVFCRINKISRRDWALGYWWAAFVAECIEGKHFVVSGDERYYFGPNAGRHA